MAKTRDQIEEEAIGWTIRLRNGASADWEAFTNWLEADPAHAAVYDEVALADAEAEALPRTPRRPPIAAPAPQPRRIGRRAVIGWGAAAALAGLLTTYAAIAPDETLYAVATGAGERREIALEDGGRIELNGATRILLDRDNPRFARLEAGEALFTVTHDEARPFRVEAGDDVLQDLGTVFNVVRGERALEVAVAEGAVLYNPGREAVDLRPGMTLRKSARGEIEIERGDAQAVGGWRDGRLSYASATVAEIADDLSRNLGVPVSASAAVADRRFTGVIVLDRDPERVFRRVAALLEVEARRSGGGWILKGAGETP